VLQGGSADIPRSTVDIHIPFESARVFAVSEEYPDVTTVSFVPYFLLYDYDYDCDT
jgi:hypothetical protein